jgi:hypothetical protein
MRYFERGVLQKYLRMEHFRNGAEGLGISDTSVIIKSYKVFSYLPGPEALS